jgi:type IX secretion system PorP/SprF family membrane protein
MIELKRHTRKHFLSCLLIFALLLISDSIYAQQDALFTQYMFNGLVINPAYAGSQDALSATFAARKQWVGIDGSPSTQTLTAHSPLKNEKVALGLSFISDNISVTHQYGVNAIYAYRLLLKDGNKLSFGLQAGFTQFKSQYSQLATRTANDPSFSSDQVSGLLPNFGTGIYYSTHKFYAGFSVPHLISNLLNDTTVSRNSVQRRHYILHSGYVFTLSHDLKLKPSVLIKAIEGAPVQIDLNTNLLIREVLWLGVSYRSFSSLNFLTQVQITDQLRFGYSYDISVNKLNALNMGSHEIMLNYNFSFLKSKVVTPRYF